MNESHSWNRLGFVALVLALGLGCSTQQSRCRNHAEIRTRADLEELATCTSIEGDLKITGSGLESLDGLESLQSVHYLVVVGNPKLRSISGLSGLRNAAGVTVQNNSSLESLKGLEGLHAVEGVVITANPKLKTLDGLSGLQRADAVIVVSNEQLTDVSALRAKAADSEIQRPSLISRRAPE